MSALKRKGDISLCLELNPFQNQHHRGHLEKVFKSFPENFVAIINRSLEHLSSNRVYYMS